MCCDFQYRDVHQMSSDAEMVRVSTLGGAAISMRIVLTDQMRPTVVSNQLSHSFTYLTASVCVFCATRVVFVR